MAAAAVQLIPVRLAQVAQAAAVMAEATQSTRQQAQLILAAVAVARKDLAQQLAAQVVAE